VAGAAEFHNLRQDPQLLEQLKGGSGNAADPAFRAALGLGANEGLEVVRTYDDGHGGTVTRYRQTLRGIPVWDEQIVIGRDASGKVYSLHGRAVSDLAAGLQRLQPTLTAEEALAAMESRVRASFGKTKPIY
jgi:Zn-dependent metalloprotease